MSDRPSFEYECVQVGQSFSNNNRGPGQCVTLHMLGKRDRQIYRFTDILAFYHNRILVL